MPLATAILLIPLLADAASGVYKCRDAEGRLAYTDQPCPKSSQTLDVPKDALKDAPVTWLCQARPEENDAKLAMTTFNETESAALERARIGPELMKLAKVRRFRVRESLYICDETQGVSYGTAGSVGNEIVITGEGHVWMRRSGKVTHIAPPKADSAPVVPVITPASPDKPGG